jgi:hypothetical protein
MSEPQRTDSWTGGLLVTGSNEIGYNIPDWRDGTRGFIEYQEQSAMSQNSEWVDKLYDGDDMHGFIRALVNIDKAVNLRLVSAHLIQKDGDRSMPGGSFGGPEVGGKPERFDVGAPTFGEVGNIVPAGSVAGEDGDAEDGDGDGEVTGGEGGTSGTSGTAPRPAPPRPKQARR